jgi:hypothetical protein
MSSSGSNNVTSIIASVSPADGATDVAPSTPITITFTGPMDTMSVMNNMYLAGGQPMHEWHDSLNYNGGFGMMGMGMQDHMMMWLDSIDIPGYFHWGPNFDSCQFVPDSGLMSGTDYMYLLHDGGMHDGHGGMMGGGDHDDNGYHLFEFTTGP